MKRKLLLIILSIILGTGLGFGIDYLKHGSFVFAERYFPQDWTSGLVGYWSFDGPNTILNSTTSDLSGNNNNGTLGSTTAADAADPTPVAGVSGQALSFDGVDDYVRVPDNDTLDLSTAGSIEYWIRYNSIAGSYQWILIKGDDGNINYGTVKAATNQVLFNYGPAWSDNLTFTLSTSESPNTWYHHVFTFSGGYISFYHNGQLINTTSGSLASSSTNALRIGSRRWGTGNPQVIDEVRIYNRALTATEIQEHYVLGARKLKLATSNPLPNETALKGYWSFDGPTIQGLYATATDMSGNGNNGTFGASPSTGTDDPTPAPGIIGQALSFDGVNDEVYVADSASLRPTTFSVEAWINPLALAQVETSGRVVGKFNWAAQKGFFIDWDNNQRVGFFFADEISWGNRVSATNSAPLNTWTHIVAIYNGTVYGLYLNGNLVGNNTKGFVVSTSTLTIGAEAATYKRFNGLIDEVRIYNRALSATEIQEHYVLGARKLKLATSNPLPNETALKGYWSFDGPTIQGLYATATDMSGNGNNGTFGASPSTGTDDPAPAPGVIGQALSFDGVNDYVSMGMPASLDNGKIWTREMWIKRGTDTGLREYISTTGNQWTAYSNRFFIDTDDEIQLEFQEGVSPFRYGAVASVSTINVGRWYHIVVTFDNSYLRMYVNGILEETSNDLSSLLPPSYQAVQFGRARGATQGVYEYNFNGLIDEVRIYNRALTATEIQEHYNLGRRNLGI
jgi:hypothetical protein